MGGLCLGGYFRVALPAFSNLCFLAWRHLLFSSLLRLTQPGPMCLRICSFSVLQTSRTLFPLLYGWHRLRTSQCTSASLLCSLSFRTYLDSSVPPSFLFHF